MKKIVYDSHMHTPLSCHTLGWPDDFAKVAVKRNLKGIIFTDHAPLPRRDTSLALWNMDRRNITNYHSLIEKTKEAFKNDLDIRIGLEIDYFPPCREHVEELASEYDYDYFIGSSHPTKPDLFKIFYGGLSTLEGYKLYYQELYEIAASGLFDCVSHPDVVKRCYDKSTWEPEKFEKEICKFLDEVKKQDMAIEYNTSGFIFVGEMYPCDFILNLIKERDLPVVIGSDSHEPERVGESFEIALKNLKNLGYKEACYYLKRKRYSYNIDEALESLIPLEN